MAETVPAVALLRSWLRDSERSQKALAVRLGCSESLTWRWMAGTRRPSYELAASIERLSDGAVPVAAWARSSDVEKICTDSVAPAE